MICVDASLAIKWVLDEDRSDAARLLLQSWLRNGDPLVAPPLLPMELTNVIFKYGRTRPWLDREQLLALLDAALALPIDLQNPEGLHREALVMAADLELPATYDAHYLALARRLGCDLWTDDRKLLRQVGTTLPFVRWIGDLDPTR